MYCTPYLVQVQHYRLSSDNAASASASSRLIHTANSIYLLLQYDETTIIAMGQKHSKTTVTTVITLDPKTAELFDEASNRHFQRSNTIRRRSKCGNWTIDQSVQSCASLSWGSNSCSKKPNVVDLNHNLVETLFTNPIGKKTSHAP
jgi:IS30 family transposase